MIHLSDFMRTKGVITITFVILSVSLTLVSCGTYSMNDNIDSEEITDANEENENIAVGDFSKLTLDESVNCNKNVYLSNDEEYRELAEKIKGVVISREFPGSLLIATDEQIIYASGTDCIQKDGEVVSPYTTYQIGSITKTYTATCILRLIQEGKLALDDKMDKFFPECKAISDITVYQLLHMNSGIPDIVNFPEKAFAKRGEEFTSELVKGSLSSERIVEYLKDCVFVFEPGTKVEYSNTNYILLALIIEKVTGMSYADYLNQNIILPLELDNTVSGDIENVTCAYSYPELPFRFEDNLPLMKGAGDVTSNVLDILQFDRALFAGKLLKLEYLDLMFDFKDDYSCGWMKDNAKSVLHLTGNRWEASDVNTVYHGGRTPGFVSYNIVLQGEERYYAIFLFNDNDNTEESGRKIYSRLADVLKLL